MERQVDKLVRLVDDLLDASRITQGKIELKKEIIDLGAVVRESVESTAPQFEAGGHKLDVDLPQHAVIVEGDAVRLEQVVTNLLTNAARYSDRGRPVTLSLRDDEGRAVFCVKDAGIGIAPEMLSRIFDLFVQVDASPARDRGGLGIGLSLVRQLVNLHGGRVEARSAGLGQGSDFVVTLPLAEITGALTSETKRRPAVARLDTAPRRVLVVDDNVDAATSLAMLLKMAGNEVRVAHSGPAALEVAGRFQPAVILLDIGLPGMDGYTVASELRKRRETAPAILVAVSGYGQDEDRRRSRAAGFDAHLLKPVSFDTVKELVAQARPATANESNGNGA